ncbi:MAG: 6-phosphofructokinase, partial [Desulfobacteraceae bacterium]|nr:6-phosphofructokinase [Desulfobacteraceae bacterium]
MTLNDLDLVVPKLGECRITSPMSSTAFVDDGERVLFHSTLEEAEAFLQTDRKLPCFEMAGPREKIYFDPSKLKCGIVTCGGICPGLNDVIRAIVLSLHHHYGIQSAFGFRYGYEGLAPAYRHPPVELGLKEV